MRATTSGDSNLCMLAFNKRTLLANMKKITLLLGAFLAVSVQCSSPNHDSEDSGSTSADWESNEKSMIDSLTQNSDRKFEDRVMIDRCILGFDVGQDDYDIVLEKLKQKSLEYEQEDTHGDMLHGDIQVPIGLTYSGSDVSVSLSFEGNTLYKVKMVFFPIDFDVIKNNLKDKYPQWSEESDCVVISDGENKIIIEEVKNDNRSDDAITYICPPPSKRIPGF